jgi:hypothetical protein
MAAAPDVARLLAAELGWDDAEVDRQVAEFVALCDDEIRAGQVSESADA